MAQRIDDLIVAEADCVDCCKKVTFFTISSVKTQLSLVRCVKCLRKLTKNWN